MAAGISTRNRATMEKSSLLLQVESLCGATGYALRTPRLEDTVLDSICVVPIYLKSMYIKTLTSTAMFLLLYR